MNQSNPLDIQIAGNHYKDCAIQPVEYSTRNNFSFLQGCVVKRITRYNKDGGKGIQDLEKIKHECDLLIAFECEKEVQDKVEQLPKIGQLVVVENLDGRSFITPFVAYIEGAKKPVVCITPTPENLAIFNKGDDGYSIDMWAGYRKATPREIITFYSAHNMFDTTDKMS